MVGKWGKAYAIDLLGYGYSDKPTPSKSEPNQIYNFENWAGAPQTIRACCYYSAHLRKMRLSGWP